MFSKRCFSEWFAERCEGPQRQKAPKCFKILVFWGNCLSLRKGFLSVGNFCGMNGKFIWTGSSEQFLLCSWFRSQGELFEKVREEIDLAKCIPFRTNKIPSDTKVVLTKNYSEIIIFKKITIFIHNSSKKSFFPGGFERVNPLKKYEK